MTSVADIPPGDDADDELSGISPELVLVDPELARLVRERAAPVGAPALPRPRRAPPLRLVPAADAEAAIVPRPAPREPAAGQDAPADVLVVDQPVVPVVDETVVPVVDEAVVPVVEEAVVPVVDGTVVPTSAAPPPQSPPAADPAPAMTTVVEVAERVVEAEPARAVDPPRRPIPPPLSEPVRRTGTRPSEHLQHASQGLGAAAEPVMPHPVKRTSVAPHPARATRSPGRGRRVLALVAGVAAAAVAVLAVLQLTGGPSETTRTTAGPQAKSPAPAPRRSAPVAKPAGPTASTPAKPKATTGPKPKSPATPKPTAGSAKPNAKASAATRPRIAPAGAASPKAAKPAKAAPAAASGAPPATRRFAWAPVAGAIGYHVELFKGADRVLVRDTKEPVLELPATWRYQGRAVKLTPGTYRWYVWPVTKSGRAPQAVVQAKLTI